MKIKNYLMASSSAAILFTTMSFASPEFEVKNVNIVNAPMILSTGGGPGHQAIGIGPICPQSICTGKLIQYSGPTRSYFFVQAGKDIAHSCMLIWEVNNKLITFAADKSTCAGGLSIQSYHDDHLNTTIVLK